MLDFTWVRAGPWATRWLGAFGAEVVKIEWPENIDILRHPRWTVPGTEPGPNSSSQFPDTNANKLGITPQRKDSTGLELVKDLIRVSDIVIENFSSRVMRNWGLGYEELRKLRPDIIYISMAGFRSYRTVPQLHQHGTLRPGTIRHDFSLRVARQASGRLGLVLSGRHWWYVRSYVRPHRSETSQCHREGTARGPVSDGCGSHSNRGRLPGPHGERTTVHKRGISAREQDGVARFAGGEQLQRSHSGAT